MSKPSAAAAPFTLLLVLTLAFASNSVVFGSPVDGHTINRPDPLRHLHHYHGGYDLSNKHYWASTAFTGVHGFVMAGIWMLFGLAFGILVMILKKRSASSPTTDYLDRYYVVSSLLLLFFTILVIAATGFVYAGNHQAFKRTKNLKNSIVEAGQDASHTLKKVAKALTGIQYLLNPYEPNTSSQLNVTSRKLGSGSQTIISFVQTSGHSIDKAIYTSYALHVVIVTLNLIFVVGAIVLLLLHWHPGFIAIIFLCWILTTLGWVLTGVDFFIFTFAADTCSALEDFVQHPQNNSLSSVLPCLDSSQSTKLLADIGSSVSRIIKELDSKIEDAYGSLGLDDKESDISKYGKICNPFTEAPNYTYVPHLCANNSLNIGDLPKILISLTCYNKDSAESCESEGKFVSEPSYYKVRAYSHSVQKIINIYPDLQSLVECTVVKVTISDVMPNQCKSFRVTVKRLWLSMLSLSIFMVVLELIWVAKACQKRQTPMLL
ncbi:hypothetical protein JRO89_XS08G0218900 [Xanthoceras sorbifolium]|uniref:Uncharacterized protein n=1 Tax=Xanthoceras sorbifolium TaxID=99658 RepID=A0ABQ8HQT0_9ROSI|nr:hypothetical protein JRO89_XS08G0218900 [Xanthoceras sorbifolium]